ncbi:MAG: hypothetical protein LBB86_09430 [Oscillospiraceae bacterium]|nr:hypothetical protein [Oscillospiraceae bacterium]
MWIVIHMVRSQTAADEAYERLSREGFMVRVRPVYRTLSPEENFYELMTLPTEAKEASRVLFGQPDI